MRLFLVLAGVVHLLCHVAVADDRLWTHAEIMADIPNPKYDPVNFPQGARTCQLKRMAEEPWSSDRNTRYWMVTKHADVRVAVYSKQSGGYRLEHVIPRDSSESSYVHDPQWMNVTTEIHGGNTSRRIKLFTVTEYWMGTAHLKRHHVFAGHGDQLIPVKWVSPMDTLPWRLLEGQSLRKGIEMSSTAAGDGADSIIEFGFSVWNKSDGNGCPTGGHVRSEFGLFERGTLPNDDPIFELRARCYRWEPREQTDLLSFGATEKVREDSNDSKPVTSPRN